jgi:mannose-6-phosphate isomerase
VTAPALIVDEVRGDGTVLKASCRHWPLTEATKAQAVRLTTDPLAAGRLAAAVDWMMERHQTGVIPGLWRDHFAADGALLSKVAPASSLYHIAMAAFVADEKIQKLAPAA